MIPAKKIALLADFPLHSLPQGSFPGPSGHYATWLPQLAQRFQGVEDFKFHWVTLAPEARAERELLAWNQVFHVLPTWRRGRAATLFWVDRFRIRRTLRKIKPDLVHGWGTENIWGWSTLEFDGPQLFSVQGLLGLYGKLGGQAPRDRLMAFIESHVLRNVQAITTESPWARHRIEEQIGRKDVHLVEYGVADRFFEIEPRPDQGHPYALMVGTADYRKGIDVAVRLFARATLRNFCLKVVGGVSPFGEFWRRRASPNVEWLGRKSQEEVIHLLAGARCLILPTRADVCANVVKEARVMGLPVVASPEGGHIQYIQHGKNGFVCPLESPEQWEKSLLQIFLDPAGAVAMGNIGREEHRRLLEPERTVKELLPLYRKLLLTRPS